DEMQVDTSGSAFSMFCFGDGQNPSLIACPCNNFGLVGRGCENSAGTGGAKLTAVGTTNPDAVVLTETNEPPTSQGIFLQGQVTIAAGAPFGDGIRCIAQNLKRLQIKQAAGGSVSYPVGAEPSITTQSAALGDPLSPGLTRYYQRYYRDPDPVFCPV